ncbi:MAG TPA: glycosyltransferase family 4 protein [Anaerolineales bacterium]|nr:glycosyltransferase family 4 protein [Anaerolineales bacterium]
MKRRSVCLIARGVKEQNLRLQPWRYLVEVVRGLAARGHPVLLVSDGDPGTYSCRDIQISNLSSVSNLRWRLNKDLHRLIQHHQPDVILQHIGLTSLLHQDFDPFGGSAGVGIFTSPIYRPRDISGLGLGRLIRRLPLTGAHLIGSCMPWRFVRLRLEQSPFQRLVVQTQTTRDQLFRMGVRTKPITVISPGVDQEWRVNGKGTKFQVPSLSHFHENENVFVYFGPADEVRGFYDLMKGFDRAFKQDNSLRLVALVRRDRDVFMGESFSRNKISECLPNSIFRIETNPLSSGDLVARVAEGDAVVLPFALIPSDAPLSVIEAVALGKPVVTTQVACLPELVAVGVHFLARPGDVDSLTQALLQAAGYLRRERQSNTSRVTSSIWRERSWQVVGEEWSNLIQSL